MEPGQPDRVFAFLGGVPRILMAVWGQTRHHGTDGDELDGPDGRAPSPRRASAPAWKTPTRSVTTTLIPRSSPPCPQRSSPAAIRAWSAGTVGGRPGFRRRPRG